MKTRISLVVVLAIPVVFITACNETLPANQVATPVLEKPLSVTKTFAPTIVSKKPTIEIETELTSSQVQTIKITPTEAIEPTTESTNTPDYLWDEFLKLYDTNGGCELPCWWGVIPGKTTRDEVSTLFAPYESYFTYEDDVLYYSAPNDSIDYAIASSLYYDENEIVETISLDGESAMYNGFSPTYLISNHGKPDHVLISLIPPEEMTMFYRIPGIVASYAICNKGDDNYCFCAFDGMILDSSMEDLSLSDVKKYSEAQMWDEVTDNSIQTFYDAFMEWKGTENCFSLK